MISRRTAPGVALVVSSCLLLVAGCDRWSPGAGESAGPRQLLVIDPDTRLEIVSGPHRAGLFERERYFRTYQFPGLYDAQVNDELKALEAPPGRGIGPGFGMDADPLADAAGREQMASVLRRWTGFSLAAKAQFPGLSYAMAGSGDSWPKPWLIAATGGQAVDASMSAHAAKRGFQPQYFGAAADAVAGWLAGVESAGGLMPSYYSVINEPDASYKDIGAFIAYHRTVAARLAKDFPEVKMTGPCTAWGYPKTDFSRWDSGWEGRFIDEAGDTVGAYDFHFYSKGYWAFIEQSEGWNPAMQQDHPSLHAVQRTGVGTIWDFGRLPAFLDMVATRHLARWGGDPPAVIVSEFGHQGIHRQKGPWENEFKSLLYMNTVVRMWMTFFGRPEVKLTVPFILPRSERNNDETRGQALYNRPGFPADETFKPTPFVRFYAVFKDLAGTRVSTRWENPAETPEAVSSLALRDGDKLRVLLHNGRDFGTEFPVGLSLPSGARLVEARSIRWEGPLPERVDPTPKGRLVFDDRVAAWRHEGKVFSSELAGEETQLLTFDLVEFPAPSKVATVRWVFATVGRGVAPPGEFLEIGPPPSVAAGDLLRLRLGLAKDGGFLGGVRVDTGGGWFVDVPHGSSVGVKDYHGTLVFDWPPQASGPARVSLPEGGRLSSAVWEIETRK
jgi:hypothetical protein